MLTLFLLIVMIRVLLLSKYAGLFTKLLKRAFHFIGEQATGMLTKSLKLCKCVRNTIFIDHVQDKTNIIWFTEEKYKKNTELYLKNIITD